MENVSDRRRHATHAAYSLQQANMMNPPSSSLLPAAYRGTYRAGTPATAVFNINNEPGSHAESSSSHKLVIFGAETLPDTCSGGQLFHRGGDAFSSSVVMNCGADDIRHQGNALPGRYSRGEYRGKVVHQGFGEDREEGDDELTGPNWRRPAPRMSCYTQRLSYFFLFLLFVFALVNVGVVIAYVKRRPHSTTLLPVPSTASVIPRHTRDDMKITAQGGVDGAPSVGDPRAPPPPPRGLTRTATDHAKDTQAAPDTKSVIQEGEGKGRREDMLQRDGSNTMLTPPPVDLGGITAQEATNAALIARIGEEVAAMERAGDQGSYMKRFRDAVNFQPREDSRFPEGFFTELGDYNRVRGLYDALSEARLPDRDEGRSFFGLDLKATSTVSTAAEALEQHGKNFKSIETYESRGVLLPTSVERESYEKRDGGGGGDEATVVTEGGNAYLRWPPGALPRMTQQALDYFHAEAVTTRAYDPRVYLQHAFHYREDLSFPYPRAIAQSVGVPTTGEATAAGQENKGSRLTEAVSFCDSSDADYTITKDFACERYLSDPRNWLAIKPLGSALTTGRTIKFLISYRHANVTAIVKVPQIGFVLEPFSEVSAYAMDRLLGFNRVPPTVLREFPIDFLKAATASLKSTFYTHWVREWVLVSKATARARRPCTDTVLLDILAATKHITAASARSPGGVARGAGRDRSSTPACLMVSMQLWLNDVDAVESTVLANTEAMQDTLRHFSLPVTNDHRWSMQRGRTAAEAYRASPPYIGWREAVYGVGATSATTNVSKQQQQQQQHESGLARGRIAVSKVVESILFRGTAAAVGPHKPLTDSALAYIATTERFDQLVFDTVIDNRDRWAGHNTFALAACSAHPHRLGCRYLRRQRYIQYLRWTNENPWPSSPETFADASSAIVASGASANQFAEYYTPQHLAASPPSRSHMRLVYLDQGSGFYRSVLHKDSPFNAATFRLWRQTQEARPQQQQQQRRLREAETEQRGRGVQRYRHHGPLCRLARGTLLRLDSIARFALNRSLEDLEKNGQSAHASDILVRFYIDQRDAALRREAAAVEEEVVKTKEIKKGEKDQQTPEADFQNGAAPDNEADDSAWFIGSQPSSSSASYEAAAVGEALYPLLMVRLPLDIGRVLPHDQLKSACRRVWSILAHRGRCAGHYTPGEMYF